MRLFGRRLLLLVLLIVALAFSLGVWNIARKARESATLKHQAQAQFADLSKREGQLTSDIEKLKTDRGKEEALRQQYALAAEGEKLIVIIDSTDETLIVATSTSLMQRFMNFFAWW